jgi:hypothetical protein
MNEEHIDVEEEATSEESKKEKKTWEEQIHVDSDEIVGKVQELIKEATVRKITIKDEKGKTLLSIPLYAGFASLVIFGPWNALALLAAWVAKFSIIIEREATEASAEAEEAGEEKAPEEVAAS